MNAEAFLYYYRAAIVRVIDGDSVVADVDLGMHTTRRCHLRLAGIDAPEMRGEERPAGISSKAFLARLIAGKEVTVRTERDRTGKYGRWLATIYLGDQDVNAAMVEAGKAVAFQ